MHRCCAASQRISTTTSPSGTLICICRTTWPRWMRGPHVLGVTVPSKARRPCRHPGCAGLSDDGWCVAHREERVEVDQRRELWRGSAASRGYDSEWRAVRLQVLKDAHWLCTHCLACCRISPATDVHHLRKIVSHPELRLDADNLIAVCRSCHEILERSSV